MNIPEKVRIGSMDYSVNKTDKVLVLDARQCLGTIDYNTHEIEINSKLTDEQGQKQTFLHELFHGIIRENNINIGDIDEEMLVESLAKGLYQVIKDNGEMFNQNVNIESNLDLDGISNYLVAHIAEVLEKHGDETEEDSERKWYCIAHWLNSFYQDFILERKAGEYMPCNTCDYVETCKDCPLINFQIINEKTNHPISTKRIKKNSNQGFLEK